MAHEKPVGPWKRIIVVLVSTVAFLAGLGATWYGLGLRSVIGAFLFNFLPLGWPPCVKRCLPLSLPACYYRLRGWETNTRVYERLGVRLFQRLMRTPVFGILNRDIPRRFRHREYAEAEREMRFAETSHVLAFFLALVMAVYAVAERWWDAAAYLITFDVLVNAYPVMLQRYNRGRLQQLMLRRRREHGHSASCSQDRPLPRSG